MEAQSLAEKSQRQAEDAAVELNDTLTRSQFVTGHEQLASENKDLALAYFARSLRTKPSHWQSAAQIVSLLSNNNFPIGDTKTLEQEEPFRYHGVDKSKRFIWSLTDDQVGALWVASTGEKVATLNEGKRVNWPYFTDSGDHLFVTLPDQGGSLVGMGFVDEIRNENLDARAAATRLSGVLCVHRPGFGNGLCLQLVVV